MTEVTDPVPALTLYGPAWMVYLPISNEANAALAALPYGRSNLSKLAAEFGGAASGSFGFQFQTMLEAVAFRETVRDNFAIESSVEWFDGKTFSKIEE